jgi:hypothetical protein
MHKKRIRIISNKCGNKNISTDHTIPIDSTQKKTRSTNLRHREN